MSFSHCYIDYSKQNKNNIDKADDYKEVKIESSYADIYFNIQKSDEKTSFIEDSRFVLLIDGTIENEELTDEKVMELIEDIGIYKALDLLEGVFSLTLYDKSRNQFYVSRDHFGLISSYYYKKDDVVLFSSTLKAFKNSPIFKKEINFDTLGQYLQYSYILQPNTIFKNCYRVKSASILRFDLMTKEVHNSKYWDIVDFYNLPKTTMSEEDIIKKSENLLSLAINKQIKSSDRVGASLSGGYDSSAITAILSKDKTINLETFTVGFEDSTLDEAPFAKKIAKHLGVNHNEYYFDAKHLESLLMKFADVYDEPLADMAALPTMLICEKSSQKIDILFGGEGGDEIFASSEFINRVKNLRFIPYPIRLLISYIFKPFSMSIKYEKLSKMFKQKNIENILKYKDITLSFDSIKKLIKAPVNEQVMIFNDSKLNPSSHILDKFFPLIFKSYVTNNLLTKISFATKAYNITPKAPYLDKKFVEFLATVDISIKKKNGKNKYILTKIIQNFIPSNLIERPKKGFSVPVGDILKNELKAFLDTYINEDRLTKEGIFEVFEVMKLKKRFLNSNSLYDEQNIWNILIFELWYEHWFSE